ITVNDAPPAFSYSPASNIYTIRTAITTATPTSTGGTIVSCSASPALPAGLSLSNACVISGTPTAVSASTVYTVTGTNTGGNASASLTLRVKDQAQILFHSKLALSGANNGTATSSFNVWKVAVDG